MNQTRSRYLWEGKQLPDALNKQVMEYQINYPPDMSDPKIIENLKKAGIITSKEPTQKP